MCPAAGGGGDIDKLSTGIVWRDDRLLLGVFLGLSTVLEFPIFIAIEKYFLCLF